MDQQRYSPPQRRKKRLPRKEIKKIKQNMGRVNDVHTMAQKYQNREDRQLPSLSDMLEKIK